MPKLPNKSIKGANFKKWCIESIDAIIDYLSSARYLQGAPGVTIERKPSGIVIGLEKKEPVQNVQITGGTGGSSAVIGFPDYFSQSKTPVSENTSYPVSSDSWLIGSVEVAANAYQEGSAVLNITNNLTSVTESLDLYSFYNRNTGAVGLGVSVGFQIPIPANCTIYINATNSATLGGTTYIYPCI